MITDLVENGPPSTPRLLLAHGAGAPMDSDFMNTIAERISAAGIQVIRFEFEYMAKRRRDGQRRAPDRTPKLIAGFREVLDRFGPAREVVLGGKSMGGRIATMIADEAGAAGALCLGYPFHPPGKPARLRTEHLEGIRTPTLIVQGTRDPFGTRDEVQTYSLGTAIELAWMADGDHSFKPRKRSGRTLEQNVAEAADAAIEFIRRCATDA